MTPTRSLQETFKTAFAKNFLDLVLPKDIEAELLGKSGSLEVRLAATHKDIKRAQKLRYRVFFEEMNAIPDLASRLKRRDIDPFDRVHLNGDIQRQGRAPTVRTDSVKGRLICYRQCPRDSATGTLWPVCQD